MIYLARHGQTPYNEEGRFQGWSDVPLSDLGAAQAAELAGRVEAIGPGLLVSSSLERALQTARVVGEAVGLEPVVDARLAETDTGSWTHRSFDEVVAEDPDGFRSFLELDEAWRFPGGESFVEQSARIEEALGELTQRDSDFPIVVVCHRNVIRLALRARGREPDAMPENASLVEL